MILDVQISLWDAFGHILRQVDCRWRFPEKGENFKDSGSSTPEFMFEYTDPSLWGEVYSNMTSGVLELKLYEVHFADKFSGAMLARRRRTCLQSVPSAVSTPMLRSRKPSTPMPSLQGEGYLAYLRVDIRGLTEKITNWYNIPNWLFKIPNLGYFIQGFPHTKRLWTFFKWKPCYGRNLEFSFLSIFIILNDIEELTIVFLDFHLFWVQGWLNWFVYITTNYSHCPLNSLSVPAKSPICMSPNTLPSCFTSTSPSAATTSMSGSQQAGAWSGLPAAWPCHTPFSLGRWPPPWTTCSWGLAAPPGAAEMSIVSFHINILAAVESCAEAEKVHSLTV